MNYGVHGIIVQGKNLSHGTNRWENKARVFGFFCFVSLIFAVIISSASIVFGVFKGIIDSSPPCNDLTDAMPKGLATQIIDSDGELVAKLINGDSNRFPVPRNMIADDLADAFVALEDERFYEHNGIDIHGIIRAATIVVSSRDLSQGASTITQQLIKNNVFEGWTNETKLQSVKRKIQEQYLAVQLEKTASKEDILTTYMNTINLGQGTLGVQAASKRYFNKDAKDLTLSECAVIAGITQNPSRYDPIKYPNNNKGKRKIVLDKMLEQGYIDQSEYDTAINDNVYDRIKTTDEVTGKRQINTWFNDALAEQVMHDLVEEAGKTEQEAYTLLYSGGLKIYTTQDSKIQAICDEVYGDESIYPRNVKYLVDYSLSVLHADGSPADNYSIENMVAEARKTGKHTSGLVSYKRGSTLFYSQEGALAIIDEFREKLEAEKQPGDIIMPSSAQPFFIPQPQVSIVVEDQHTGYIVALVGGRGDKTANRTFNRATGSKRQPGSTFKVLAAFAPGIDSGKLTLATTFNDAPFCYNNGKPVKNWYGADSYRGIKSVREAIEQSMNVITVQAFTYITPELGFEYLKKFGFTTLVDGTEPKYKAKGMTDIQQPTCLGGLTVGVTNFELNAAYATIANGGKRVKPTLYKKITGPNDEVIIDHSDPDAEGRYDQVLKATSAYLLTDAMKGVVGPNGTAKVVNFKTTPIAGKTGTTTSNVDVWFAGYTDYYTATTWCGYDDNTHLVSGETSLAKTMWRKVMEEIHKDLEPRDFTKPDGIVTENVCILSGRLPFPGCPTKQEIFATDNARLDSCNVHVGSGVRCAVENLPAAPACPFKVAGSGASYPIPPQLVNGFRKAGAQVSATTDENGYRVSSSGLQCSHTEEWLNSPGAQAEIEQYKQKLSTHQAESQPQGNADQSGQNNQQTQPAQPAQQTQPAQPEQQAQPEQPAQPEQQAQPAQPEQQAQPAPADQGGGEQAQGG
ncbi:MAG: transglycosylase domain-containing protein [Butyrivibrio sp.]|nr:transglycosylase domain-containing protein [Butyrivibrio sp.]